MQPMKRPITIDHATGREHSQASERLQRLRSLAWLLDNSIPLPGGFRIGVDAIVGLVPVVGDVAGALVSGFIINEARLLGAPRSVLMRMSANLVIETVLGSVPVLGDLFDAGFKANARNIALLERYHFDPQRSRRQSRWFMAGIAMVVGSLVIALAAVPVLLVVALAKLF